MLALFLVNRSVVLGNLFSNALLINFSKSRSRFTRSFFIQHIFPLSLFNCVLPNNHTQNITVSFYSNNELFVTATGITDIPDLSTYNGHRNRMVYTGRHLCYPTVFYQACGGRYQWSDRCRNHRLSLRYVPCLSFETSPWPKLFHICCSR